MIYSISLVMYCNLILSLLSWDFYSKYNISFANSSNKYFTCSSHVSYDFLASYLEWILIDWLFFKIISAFDVCLKRWMYSFVSIDYIGEIVIVIAIVSTNGTNVCVNGNAWRVCGTFATRGTIGARVWSLICISWSPVSLMAVVKSI